MRLGAGGIQEGTVHIQEGCLGGIQEVQGVQEGYRSEGSPPTNDGSPATSQVLQRGSS